MKPIAKINIVLANDIACDQLSTNGMVINNQRFYPKRSRPRPPPSRRGYLPNFPVAANNQDLEEVATGQGINIIKIQPRTYKDTIIKIGGWTLWADLDSTTPYTIHFDGQEYAIIWRGKPKKKNLTAESGKTTSHAAEPVKTTSHAAEPVKTIINNQPDEDEGMEIVMSKNQRRKEAKTSPRQ